MQAPTHPDKVGGRDAAGLALGLDGDGYDDVLVGAPGGLEAMAVLVCGPGVENLSTAFEAPTT